jgi:hypothetical protein
MWVTDSPGLPKEKVVRLAQIGLVVVALLIVGLVLLNKRNDDNKSATSGDKTGQDAGDTKTAKGWPAQLNGRPKGLGSTNQDADAVKATVKPGIYLWSGFDGWHLWVVNGSGVPAVSGTLISSDTIGKADLALKGGGVVTKAGKSATFTFVTSKPVTGMNFNPGFFSNSIAIALTGPDGKPIDTKLVHLGSRMASTGSLTFVKVK